MSTPLYATGWSLHLPGVDVASALAGQLARPAGDWAGYLAPAPEKAAEVLGRKGLLYKEPSTRLALCAVHRALGLQPAQRPDWPVQPRTAVIAASNLGNVETVAKVTRTIADEGGKAVSVLDAPNASSNIIASTVALWFAFGGPNLMLCSGASSGMDGLRMAGLLLRAGRADRVVLVGSEPDDEVATALFGAGAPDRTLRAGAACLVLQAEPGPSTSVVVEPVAGDWPRSPRLNVGPDGIDPIRLWGDCYGAQGVVALALAAHLAADEGYGTVGVRCDGENGSRAALVGTADSVTDGRS